MKAILVLFLLFKYGSLQNAANKICDSTLTTVSGTRAPNNKICSGMLIFEDQFDEFDLKTWKHDNTLAGGGNWEFQWYTNNRSNSYVQKKRLYITPTLLEDQFGDEFLNSGTLNVDGGTPADSCTNPAYNGCQRTGTYENILNPIKSARISTVDSFRFKYGKVEVSAKMPTGDWLWPAIWLMPADNAYGSWPASGEIDLVESRGNKKLTFDGVNIGVEQVSSTVRFGPYRGLDSWEKSFFPTQSESGFDSTFKKYQMEWTPDYIKFTIDDENPKIVTPPENGGFFNLGEFGTRAPGIDNPWKHGTKMTPFDEEFYIIINLAIGGTNFFPDESENPNPKPWKNDSPSAMKDFYAAKSKWLDTWKSGSSSLQVNYVKVWAL